MYNFRIYIKEGFNMERKKCFYPLQDLHFSDIQTVTTGESEISMKKIFIQACSKKVSDNAPVAEIPKTK